MRLESKKFLFDIQQAARMVLEFIKHKEFSDYEADAMVRAAVERQFEIIGEALDPSSVRRDLCASPSGTWAEHGRQFEDAVSRIYRRGHVSPIGALYSARRFVID